MALEAKSVSFRYGRRGPFVLEDVSLRVERGERVALFAPSGRGKTTLALLLAGYARPQSGQILLEGKPLPEKGVCPVQLIWQHPEKAINPRWRLRRVLEESGAIREEDLMALGIERAWLDRFPRELSGGELQRFCVARALCSGAPYLIRDGAYANTDGSFSEAAALEMKENIRRCDAVCALHERVAKCELIRHELLDAQGLRQRSIFSDGTVVTVDFASSGYSIE